MAAVTMQSMLQGSLPKKINFTSQRRLSKQFIVQAKPITKETLSKQISEKIKEAEEVCANPNSTAECAVAWDNVEELSAAASDLKKKEREPAAVDPLEAFCEENPHSDECRIYVD